MRVSEYFLPIMRDDPREAETVSHGLMLRAGMIRQESAGIYSWLPLGLRVLRKITAIVREEQNRIGAIEMLMPTLQPAELWRKSGRYDDYGQEMLRIRDRHDRPMLYGPTNEEMITNIVRANVQSYRMLPCILYQIQWKFRDEIRPRFGVMRGREFLMKDAYSFDLSAQAGRHAYNKMFLAHLRSYKRMGLTAIAMRAETGPIGGTMSHEFLILAQTGESRGFFDRTYLDTDWALGDIDHDDIATLDQEIAAFTAPYAATEEVHDAKRFKAHVPRARQIESRGIEVGQLFFFETKYSKPLGCSIQGPNGEPIMIHSGSYGIGISRLVGAIIEANHDEKGVVWPPSVAPFDVGLINLKPGEETVDNTCEELYRQLEAQRVAVLYDDTEDRAGAKFSTMDLIGLPFQLIVSPRGLAEGRVEIKSRETGRRETVSPAAAIARLTTLHEARTP